MKFKVFAIYDSKTEAWLQPFFSQSKGHAIRALEGLVSDPQHNFSKYAEDFTLFEVGDWDDSDCKFDLMKTPHSIGLLLEFKRDFSA